ncbi:hypothetical protein T484DRAFT_1810658, partial [Baffinella frigidus]
RCGPCGVSVTDFHRSFHDGLALCALVDSLVSDPSLVAMQERARTDPRDNVLRALAVAQSCLAVPPVHL